MQCELCDKRINTYVEDRLDTGGELRILCLECDRERGTGKGTMYTWNGRVFVKVET